MKITSSHFGNTTETVIKEPQAPISTEAVQIGLYSEDQDELPTLNLDVPLTLSRPDDGQVTTHFETISASDGEQSGNDEKMTGKKKLAVGAGVLALGFFLLRD